MIILKPLHQEFISELLSEFSLEESDFPEVEFRDWNEEIPKSKIEIPVAENILGTYCANTEKITIYLDGIQEAASALKMNYSDLLTIVVSHELGHWVTHKAVINGNCIETKEYLKIKRWVRELFAQLITNTLLLRDRLKDVFDTLADTQSAVYRTYTWFSKWNDWSVIKLKMIEARQDSKAFNDKYKHIFRAEYCDFFR